MTLQRILYETVGRPFLQRLIPAFTGILLCTLLADAVIDWQALRTEIAGSDLVARTAFFTGAFVAWGALAGRALRPAWRIPAIAFLIRQPINRWRWLGGLAPSLLIALLPVAMIWDLAPDARHPLIHHIGFVGLACPLLIGFSFHPRDGLIVLAPGLAVLIALFTLYWQWPSVAWIGAVATILLGAWSVSLIPRQLGYSARHSTAQLAASGPVPAMIRRDLHCLLRTERSALLRLAALSAGACAMMLALRVNGDAAGREAFTGACILVCVPAAMAHDLLERLRIRLGSEMLRLRWPLTTQQRAQALLGLLAILIAPGAASIALIGTSMGTGYLLLFTLFLTLALVACAVVSTAFLGSSRSAVSVFLLALTLLAGLPLLLPPAAYAAAALVLLPLGLRLICVYLSRFAIDQERKPHAVPA